MKFPVAISLFLGAVTAAPAGDPPAEPARGGGEERRGPGRPMHEMWKKADTDGDGSLSLEEFSAMERISKLPEEKREAIFKRFDKNGDGKLSPDELMRRHRGGMPPLDQADLDKDGKITFEEFEKIPYVARLPEERRKAMFARMDRDKDGVLTAKDRPPGPPPGGRDPRALVEKYDENGDGALSFEEFRKAPFVKDLGEDEQEDRFERMDRNGDLKIDEKDFQPPPGEPRPDRGRKP